MRHLSFWLILLFVPTACSNEISEEQHLASERAETAFRASPKAVPETEIKTLGIGAKAPDFNLPGVDGKFYTLADFVEAKALVVVFTCNHCPTAQAYEERLKQFTNDYRPKGVAVVAISPNSPLGLLYEELGYSDMGDDYEDMVIRARDHKFNFPYLYDGDNQSASILYGPTATPHVFVFDETRSLQYVGRIDGSEKPGTANGEDLRAAVDSILEGREVEIPVTKSFGCSTKWAWKSNWKAKVEAEWSQEAVELQEIDTAGIKALLKNDSNKLRLINLWATWCGPCIVEFPELIVIHRMFKGRDFEFVSLSADSPESKDEVLKFLQENNAAVKNFIYDSEDQYELIEAVDPNWSGALPYTLLVEPGGKTVYAKQGIIDPLEMKRKIVDHPMIGRYYM